MLCAVIAGNFISIVQPLANDAGIHRAHEHVKILSISHRGHTNQDPVSCDLSSWTTPLWSTVAKHSCPTNSLSNLTPPANISGLACIAKRRRGVVMDDENLVLSIMQLIGRSMIKCLFESGIVVCLSTVSALYMP